MPPVKKSVVKSKSVQSPTKPKTPPHVVIKALAGTGKTTTLVEGLKYVLNGEQNITPSPEQEAIWEQMKLSSGVFTVAFCAFNKSIATELQRRVPAKCQAMTNHSLGFKSVMNEFGRVEVSEYRVDDILTELLGFGVDSKKCRKKHSTLMTLTRQLVSLTKMNLGEGTKEELCALVEHYNIDLDDVTAEQVYQAFGLVPAVLELCRDVRRDRKIDYDDMVWLPCALNLPVSKFDLLLVDESQDLNRCQQELLFRAGRRLILVGDENQAIYGFAGADSESMRRMEKRLSETEAGCVVLPLNVTRRCGMAIVEEARSIVPQFVGLESNGVGRVLRSKYPMDMETKEERPADQVYLKDVRPGDMIICRVNAPLVSQCFRLIKMGVRATIQGRDIGKGLLSTLRKITNEGDRIETVIPAIENWLASESAKENAKRNPSEVKLMGLMDRADCLLCFANQLQTTDSVESMVIKIQTVFTDDKTMPGVRLSSIHRAKGLEAKNVFFLVPKGSGCPHPMAKKDWQREQERHLKYVGITRAIETLTYVD